MNIDEILIKDHGGEKVAGQIICLVDGRKEIAATRVSGAYKATEKWEIKLGLRADPNAEKEKPKKVAKKRAAVRKAPTKEAAKETSEDLDALLDGLEDNN